MIISLDKFKKNAVGSGGIDMGSIGYGKDDNAAVNNKLMEVLNLGHSETLFSNWDKNNTSAYNLYAYDYDLKYAPAIDTSNVHTMEGMFRDCSNLVYVPKYDMSNVRNTSVMFSNCSALENIPEIDMTNVQSTTGMFMNCGSLKEIRLTGNPEQVINASQMFDGCSANIMFPDIEQFAQVKSNAEAAGCILSPYLPSNMVKASFYLSGANGYQDLTSTTIYWGTDTSNINNPMIYIGNGDWKATLPEGTEGPIYFKSSAYGFAYTFGNGNASIMPGEVKEFSDVVPITIPNTYVADCIQSASDANGVTGVSGGMTIRQSYAGDWMTLNIPVKDNYNNDNVLYKFRFDIMLNAISQIRIYTTDYTGNNIISEQMITLDNYAFEFTVRHADIFARNKYSTKYMNMTIEVLDANIIQWQTFNVETIMNEKPDDKYNVVRNLLIFDSAKNLLYTDKSEQGTQVMLHNPDNSVYNEYRPVNVEIEDDKMTNSYIIHEQYKSALYFKQNESDYYSNYVWREATPNGTPLIYSSLNSCPTKYITNYEQCYIASENVEYDATSKSLIIYKNGWAILKFDNIPNFCRVDRNFCLYDPTNYGSTDWKRCSINNQRKNLTDSTIFFGKYFLFSFDDSVSTDEYVKIKFDGSWAAFGFQHGNLSNDQLMHPMFAHVKVDITRYDGTAVTDADLDASRVTICGYPAKYAFCNEGYGSWKSWTIADDIPSYIVAKLTDNRDICIDGEVVGTVNIDPDSAAGSYDSFIFEPSDSGDSTANTYHLIAENTYDMEYVEDDWYRVSVADINTNANIAKNLVLNKEDGSTTIEKMFGAEGEPRVGDNVGLVNVKYPASESIFTIKTTGILYVWFNEKQNLIAFTDTDDFKTMVNMEITK